MRKSRTEGIEQLAAYELLRRGITLGKVQRQRITIYGEDFNLPTHDERAWFRNYVRHCIREKGMSSDEAAPVAREAYALLRYKQALAGSSDGSQFSAFMAATHVPDDKAKEIYSKALKDFDSRVVKR